MPLGSKNLFLYTIDEHYKCVWTNFKTEWRTLTGGGRTPKKIANCSTKYRGSNMKHSKGGDENQFSKDVDEYQTFKGCGRTPIDEQ